MHTSRILNEKTLMTKHLVIVAGVLVATSLFGGQAHAQRGGSAHSVGNPTASPYLNLLTADAFGNVGIGGGYQTLVKPLVDGRKAINANSAAISRLASGVAEVPGAEEVLAGSLYELLSLLPGHVGSLTPADDRIWRRSIRTSSSHIASCRMGQENDELLGGQF